MVQLRNKKHLEIKHQSRKNTKPLDIHQLSPLKYSIGKCDPT